MIGQTISHYKILEKLGEGGMGVVYKARDTTLDREVALKFLPHDLIISDEERTRFIHEAKSASALDHPNICTIYEVAETPEGRMFIAMGYYEGTPLNRKIQKGRLEVEEAAGIAIQIAEGLRAAHEQGIVHRDIKSGNIILTGKGQVKILDFGLARKTGLSKLTRTGTTVGTAAYMSPEQARGERIDERSDLWSLGVVLYEMVTGKLPFRGEHEAAILYSVVNEGPQPLEAALPNSSPELVHIIRRALEKDPAERYRTAEDMLIDLRRLKKETSKLGYEPVRSGRRKAVTRKRLTAAIAVIILCVAAYFFLFRKPSNEINPDMVVRSLQIPFTDIGDPGISGDGNWIAFSALGGDGKYSLYLMHSSGGEPRPVTPISGVAFADLSPDGSRIFYNQYDILERKLFVYIIPSNGGTPRKIGPGGGGRFRPDGQRVGYIRGLFWDRTESGKTEFWTVGIDGSDARREFIDSMHVGSGAGWANWSFSFAPDGKKIAWIRTFPERYSEVVIHDLETGQEQTVTSDRKNINEVAWVGEDRILYTTDKSGLYNLWMVPATGGTPAQITRETTPVKAVKSSTDGKRVLYTQTTFASDFWVTNIAENRTQQITFREEIQGSPHFSPDGKYIAFTVTGSEASGSATSGRSHVFVMDRDGGNRKQLSYGDEVVSEPMWFPNGRWIAYGSRKFSEPVDSFRTYMIEPSGSGSPQYISLGHPVGWLDSKRFQIQIRNTTYRTSIDGESPVPLYDDSTRAYATPGGSYIVYHNFRQGMDRGAWWVVDGAKPREIQRKTALLLPIKGVIVIQGDMVYWLEEIGKIMKMKLPDGAIERVHADFPGLASGSDFSVSWDHQDMVYLKWRSITKNVIIENLFK